ncbi:MAG: Crp/Fnr family transcriptional regulator [Saprospiraceae bacterium]|nr:Crp/Fnr family transcriptional regulator [Saprospiraceae bacterium]
MTNKAKFTACSISGSHCRCFDKLPKDEIDLINSNSVYVTFKKGEVICKQGSFTSHIMMIEEGLVKVYIENGINTLVLKIITEDNLLGLSTLREQSNVFSYSAMAYTETKIKQIDIKTFLGVLDRNATFAKEVIEILGANSEQIQGRFFCLVHKQSFGKIADILLCLADRVFKSKDFNLPISRKDFAELTGVASETASRILKKFEDDGLIIMDGKAIQILDYERLVKISETG